MLTTAESHPAWSAIVLSGGRGSRLQADKAEVVIGEASAINHVLAALPGDIEVVVVGPEPLNPARKMTVTRESPIGGGPVAALAAGLACVKTPIVAVIATDMPFAGGLLAGLARELPIDADALVPVDASGRRQPLCAAYRSDSLRSALAALGSPEGASMRALVTHLSVSEIRIADETALHDIDTAGDLALARTIMLETKGDT